MYRISLIISEVYNKFLPIAEQNGIRLDLDIIDTNVITNELSSIKSDIESAISEAIGRTTQGEITIHVNSDEIVVSDTGTTLSRPICTLLSGEYVNVTSRVGFGTKVKIKLHRSDKSNVTSETPNNKIPAKNN